MSSSSNKVKRVCPTCKTTKFRKSTDSGLVCKYGHKLLGIQQEQAEDDGFAAGRGTRRKVVSTSRDYIHKDNPLQQHSDFLLIIQFTLQVLSRCMVQELNFPPELEPTIRELWLLYVSDSKKEIEEAYMFEAHEKDVMDKTNGSQQLKRDIYENLKQEELTLDDLSDNSSSSSDEEVEGNNSNKHRVQQVGTSRLKWPRLIYSHSLVFIYLACIYLNYPILPNDLVRWCRSGQIPYLNMQERIPEEKLASLSLFLSNSMTHTPTTDRILQEACTLSKCFTANCELEFPNLNIPLYLDRFCAQFFLPVEGYYYADKIFSTYRQRHHLDLCIANRNYRWIPVTTILMSCVIAAVKLIYGVGDHNSYTTLRVSEFDTTTTKEIWMNRVQENISRWKKIDEEQDDLENIIRLIKDTTVAQKLVAAPRTKQNVMMNVLNQSQSSHSRGITDRTVRIDMLMDTYNLVQKTNDNADDTPVDHNLIEQGKFYYSRKSGLAPKDYLDVIELANLVTGQTTNSFMELALQGVDKDLKKTNHATAIQKSIYDSRYSISNEM